MKKTEAKKSRATVPLSMTHLKYSGILGFELGELTSVADPDPFDTDPDPACHSDTDPDPTV